MNPRHCVALWALALTLVFQQAYAEPDQERQLEATLQIDVQVEQEGEAREPILGTIRLESRSAEVSGEPLEVPLEIPGSVQVNLPTQSIWSVSAQASGFWSPAVLVAIPPIGHEGVAASLLLQPLASLKGTLAVEAGRSLPKEVVLYLNPPREGRGPGGEVQCSVAEEGKFHCPVPAGIHDLRLFSHGFASVYFWGVEVPEGANFDIGAIQLQSGASVTGRVELAEGVEPSTRVLAQLQILQAGDLPPKDERRLEAMSQSTIPDAGGAIRFVQLAAGTYQLLVTAEGAAATIVRPIHVYPGRESRLAEPVIVEVPAVVEWSIDPLLTPKGERWRMSLVPQRNHRGSWVQEEVVDFDGSLRQEGIQPGRYKAQLKDRYGFVWWSAPVEFRPDLQRIDLVVEAIAVWGEVSLGGDPVRSRMRFRRGTLDQRVSLYSGPDGRFSGVLPESGIWNLDVLFRRNGSWQNVGEVEIERVDGEESAYLKVELPDTKVSGWVRDKDGKPMAGARVNAARPGEGTSSTDTDRNGQFHFRGLPEATYVFVASGAATTLAAAQVSEPVRREIRKDEDASDLTLVLSSSRALRGRVLSQLGPLPGARVQLLPESEKFLGLRVVQGRTGADGAFEAHLPSTARAVVLIASATGFATRFVRVAIDDVTEIPPVLLADYGGSLSVDLSSLPPRLRRQDVGRGILFQGDIGSPLHLLADQARLEWDEYGLLTRWNLPLMEVGTYQLCSSVDHCSEAFLPPHGQVELAMPTLASSSPSR